MPQAVPEEREEVTRAPNAVELAATYQIGLELLDADVENMTDESFAALADNETALHAKLLGYGVAIKIHKREAESFRAQKAVLQDVIDELEHKAKMVGNQAERKRIRLHEIMKFLKLPKVKGPHATVFEQKNPPALDVLNETLALEALPEEFIRTTRAIAKSVLLDAIKADGDFSNPGWGVALKAPSTTLRIR